MPAEPSIAARLLCQLRWELEAGSGYCRSGSCRSLGSYLYQFRFFIKRF